MNADVVEWQTRYFEGVVGVCSCEFKSHRPHQYETCGSGETADTLSSGGSEATREGSNPFFRTNR